MIANAEWHGPVPNVGSGGRSVRLVVVHIMEGTLEGTDGWFHNPAAQVSADVGTGKDGRLWQWVDPAQQVAWAEANYNANAISIENEGQSGDSLTAAQIQRCGEVLAWANKTYGVPLAITTDPNGAGLIGHGQLGAAGGNHPDCPGQPILDQFPQILAAAQGTTPQGDDMPLSNDDLQKIADDVVRPLLTNFWVGQFSPKLDEIINRLKALETKAGIPNT